MKKIHQAVALLLAGMLLCSCGNTTSPSQSGSDASESTTTESGSEPESSGDSQTSEATEFKLQKAAKKVGDSNPISPNYFFADPTTVEYEGRLYVYGTCDSQQFKQNNGKGGIDYNRINKLACYSTDDMKNWTYHGDIEVNKICRWTGCSWAPSIVSRKLDSGETEFFLFFANSSNGIGVMKSNSPLGPWTDATKGPDNSAKGGALIDHPTLQKLCGGDDIFWCFDPGVVIDDKGVAYMAFGGGEAVHGDESGIYTGNCRIVRVDLDKLGYDEETNTVTGLDSDIIKVPVPYHFEANELNYINGKYILTYCSNYADRNAFEWKYDPIPKPQTCSMCYMVSDNPLDPDSWVYGGEYLKNANQFGMDFSNNHSHLHKFQGKYYLFYQNESLLTALKKQRTVNSTASGYRSVGVDALEVDEANASYGDGKMTMAGVEQLKNFDPFQLVEGETANTTAGIEVGIYQKKLVASGDSGSWICLTGVDFKDGASKIDMDVLGIGTFEIRLDDKESKAVATVSVDSEGKFTTVTADLKDKISGVHDFYIIYCSDKLKIDSWQAKK